MRRFVEDATLADVAFEAEAATLAELLSEACLAVSETMIRDLSSIAPREERRIEVEAEEPERLLHRALEEIVYYKDAERLVFGAISTKVQESGGKLNASMLARGETLDSRRHEEIVDVKAVTWHRFRVERTPTGWRAFVVLDI